MPTVAIVDNQTLMRKAFALFCQHIGLLVQFQTNSCIEMQEYLTRVQPPPDIIFMNIDLPTMDGIAATAFLSANYPSIKVITLSVFCNERLIIDMLKNGAKAYLPKSADTDEILRAIDAVVNGRRYIPHSIMEEWKIPADYLNTDYHRLYKTQLLNHREYEFLSYCASDLSYKEIAERMGVQYKTIDTYRATVAAKLNIHTRAGLVVYAVRHGFSPPPAPTSPRSPITPPASSRNDTSASQTDSHRQNL